MSSVDPLIIGYSFTAARGGASDKVDLAALDGALAQVTDKLNEIVAALDVVTRDDDTLKDTSIEPRHFSDEVAVDIAGQINESFIAQTT